MNSDGGSVGDARAVVVGRLRARRVELVEAIFARVRAGAFADSGEQDAEYVAGLRAAVAVAVEYAFEGIERGEEGLGPAPALASEQARRAARAGVSLDTVLRRYVVGHTLLEEFVMEEVERGGRDWIPHIQRDVLRRVLRAQAAVLDRLLAAITVEYGDELACMARSPERRLLELVRRLLAGERVDVDGDGHGAAGAGLGYELDGEHVGVIARGAGAGEFLRGLAVSLDRRLLCVASGEGTVWAWFGGRHRIVMAALERVLAGGLPGEVVLAVGEPAWGLRGWRLTHRQAQAALVVALRRSGIPSPTQESIPIARYADVALLASALKDELLAGALLEVYLTPLDDSHGRGVVLRETLRAYLTAGRNTSSAAAALGVNRSTVESRLRTVEQSLGRQLPACLAELEVALRLEELGLDDITDEQRSPRS